MYDEDYDRGIYKIRDKTLKFAVEYKKVKYIHYKLYEDRLRLVLPKSYKDTVNSALKMKEKWLYKQLVKNEEYMTKLDSECRDISLLNRTENQLRTLCAGYIEKYSRQLDVRVNRLQYRDMTTKWGSCSIRSNITLSKLLAYLPDYLVAYVVYHELAHLIVLDHNDAFFEIIKKEFPDYKEVEYRAFFGTYDCYWRDWKRKKPLCFGDEGSARRKNYEIASRKVGGERLVFL